MQWNDNTEEEEINRATRMKSRAETNRSGTARQGKQKLRSMKDSQKAEEQSFCLEGDVRRESHSTN